jgi:hypothetical protein
MCVSLVSSSLRRVVQTTINEAKRPIAIPTNRIIMKLQKICCSLFVLGLAAALSGCATDSDLKSQAKLSKAEAERIALAKVPGGKVVTSELEKEDGKLIWTFDISQQGTKDITEVNVDAKTGEVVAVDVESPEKEAAEKAKEEKGEKKGKRSEKEEDDDKDEKK